MEEDRDREFTLEGLADADAGRLISHEMVREWVENLGEGAQKSFFDMDESERERVLAELVRDNR